MTKPAFIFFFLAYTTAFSQPGVFNIRAESVSHSTVRLMWDSTSVPNAARVRFGITAAYEGGPGGGIQGVAPRSLTAEDLTVNVPGLAPSTNYQFCPQVSTDGGATWSACVNFAVTTAPRPAVHPEYPEQPPAFDSTYPDTTGYTVRSVSSNCSDFQTHLNAAAAAQVTRGSIIEIQPGTVCKGAYTLPSATDVKRFNTSDVRTSTATITLVNHGFLDGQKVKLAGTLPGSAGPDPFRQFRGIKPGDVYYIKRVNNDSFQLSSTPGGAALDFTTSTFTADANANTFTVPSNQFKIMDGQVIQVKSNGALPAGLAPDTDYYVKNPSNSTTFQLSTSWNGPALDILNAGSGTHSFADRGTGGAILAWPPAQNWIIVRTAVRDEQFVPDGVRVSPEWQSKMAIIKPSGRWDTQFPIAIRAAELVHHWRFVGIEFTHDDTASAEIATTIDPHGYMGFLFFTRDAGNIIVDRCYLHGLGYPNRVARAVSGYDGESMAIINSYWDKLDWWHPYRDGVEPSMTSSSTMTISPGTYYTGPANRTLSTPVTVSFAGTASGSGKVYFDLGGALRVLLPVGMNGTCSGYSPCTVQTAANPEFPYNSDPDPRIAAAPIATINFTNGQLTAVNATMEPSTGMLEGSSSFLAGTGPGPFLIENNYISGTGIPIHFDDWGNGHYAPGRGYIIRRNHFTVPLSQIAGSPWSDGKRYGHRVQMEWKNGTHILIDGNIFENSPAENTPVAVAVLIMATGNGQITDVTISNNLVRNGAGGIAVSGPVNTGLSANPMQRVHIYNNLFHRLNGFTHAVKPNLPNGALGVQLFMGGAMEDVRIESNTVYDSRGTVPLFLLTGDPTEGMSITNNVVWANGALSSTDSYGYQNTPSCPQFGKASFDCQFRSGVGNPQYEFSANTVIVGWSDREGTQPADPSWMRSMYGGLGADIYSINEAVTRLGWMVGERGSVRMGTAPESKAGSTKRTSTPELGADLEALERALGRIRAHTVQDVRATSAVVSFVAPAKGAGCYVLYGTGADVTSYSRTGVNRSDSLERRIELRDLHPGFRHQYTVMCEGAQDQPRGVFETRTQ